MTRFRVGCARWWSRWRALGGGVMCDHAELDALNRGRTVAYQREHPLVR
ncbi:hypothetical protein [Nonomuraea mesophila]|nr:hypothetical protein [Nonomuraea mesophila]